MNKNKEFKLLLFSIYITFIGFVISQITFINIHIKEIGGIVTSIGIILIPIEVILFLLNNKIALEKEKSASKQVTVKKYLLIASFIIMSITTVYLFNTHVSTVYTYSNLDEHSTFEKVENNNKYYISLKNDDLNMILKCSKEQYNELTPAKDYVLVYKWSNFSPNEGKLIKIYTK